ncbi:aminopeptidase Ape2 [Schizosaccharomyces octosporus yFS286]|uniref:Aminopeptidase n=1 Tax=Schizosaccharomyces octosporus (strain yFS286) TaxID=483514 RepID=S9PYR3_SCHOY|nr:aminopeptidase Ape2 [Schizosaccharomyces octosporus yFS286]EPX72573.1 aminopeptidase Ape2 [Schizosaccharomyces octosporus yFS286]
MQVTVPSSGSVSASLEKDENRNVLPKNVKPIHYDLSLYPDLETFAYGGNVNVSLDVIQDSDTITLHGINLRILSAALEWGHQTIWTNNVTYRDERIILQFSSIVPANSVAVLKLAFTGVISKGMEGFYRSSYVDADGKTKYLATTQMEPTSARRAFPCWDEPALKATFSIDITAKSNYTILSNMNINEEVIKDDMKTARFAKTCRMSTYLLAWIVAELEYVECFTPGKHCPRLPVRVYTTPGFAQQGKFAADLGAKTIDFFSGAFNEAYPLPKCDMVAIPDFEAGAMENWGLITYRLSAILVSEDSAATVIQRVAEVVQHELAHQWFGNLVTMQFWDGLWLNEGFATWMSWFSCHNFYPEWKVWESYVTDELQSALALDALRSSHPIEVPIIHEYEINQIFDAISYSKGSCVIRMISKYVGEDVFIRGIQKYISRHRYNNTITEDLWAAISEESGQDISTMMKCWTKSTGYPVISVSETKEGKLHIEQHRFLSTGDVTPEDDKTLYWVPLKLKTIKDGKPTVDEKLVLSERSVELPLSQESRDAYKLNSEQSGIYRVQYTADHLKKLAKVAVEKPEFLSVEDRAGLIADVASLSRAGYGNVSSTLDLAKTWKEEPSFVVFTEILARLNGIKSTLRFEKPEIVEALKKFILEISSVKAHKLGWSFDSSDDHISRQFKSTVFGFAGVNGDKKVVSDAIKMFEAYAAGDKKAINDNLRSSVFIIAVRHGDPKCWDQLLDIYKKSNDPYVRTNCLRAFGYTENDEYIEKTLQLALDPIVKEQDLYLVLSSLSSHKKGVVNMWKFATTHWEQILKRLPIAGTMRGHVVRIITGGFTHKSDIETIKKFFANQDIKLYERALQQSLDSISSSSSFIEKSLTDITEWLKHNNYA